MRGSARVMFLLCSPQGAIGLKLSQYRGKIRRIRDHREQCNRQSWGGGDEEKNSLETPERKHLKKKW